GRGGGGFGRDACGTGETADDRDNIGGTAPSRRRSVARIHLLLAAVARACAAPTVDACRRPVAGLAARPDTARSATARALWAVAVFQNPTRITSCLWRRSWPRRCARSHCPASPPWPWNSRQKSRTRLLVVSRPCAEASIPNRLNSLSSVSKLAFGGRIVPLNHL